MVGYAAAVRLACSLMLVALAACSVAPRDELAIARDACAWRPLLGEPGADLAGPPAPGSAVDEAAASLGNASPAATGTSTTASAVAASPAACSGSSAASTPAAARATAACSDG